MHVGIVGVLPNLVLSHEEVVFGVAADGDIHVVDSKETLKRVGIFKVIVLQDMLLHRNALVYAYLLRSIDCLVSELLRLVEEALLD